MTNLTCTICKLPHERKELRTEVINGETFYICQQCDEEEANG